MHRILDMHVLGDTTSDMCALSGYLEHLNSAEITHSSVLLGYRSPGEAVSQRIRIFLETGILWVKVRTGENR